MEVKEEWGGICECGTERVGRIEYGGEWGVGVCVCSMETEVIHGCVWGRGCMRMLEGEGDRGWKVVFGFDN